MQTLNDMLSLYAAIKEQSGDMTLLFKDAELPESVNYKDLAGTIIVRFGTCPVMVSRTEQFKYMSDLFFRTHYDNFSRVADAMLVDYSPLENYDRQEEWTDKNMGTRKNSGTQTDSGGNGGTLDKTGKDKTMSQDSGNDAMTHEVSAYNVTTYSQAYKDTTNYGKKFESEIDYGSRDITDYHHRYTREDDLQQKDSYTTKHKARIHGNIGVTTSQQMLQAEIDLRIKNNVYDMIASQWADTMLLSTW